MKMYFIACENEDGKTFNIPLERILAFSHEDGKNDTVLILGRYGSMKTVFRTFKESIFAVAIAED